MGVVISRNVQQLHIRTQLSARSEELPMCQISMDISQNQSLTQSSEFQPLIHTLHLGAICLRKIRRIVLFKKRLKPPKGYKRDSMMNLKMYLDYTNALEYLMSISWLQHLCL